MREKICPISSFQYKDEGAGSFTAYGSVFGVVDLQNEVTVPGCFKDSLPDWITKGHVHLNHDRNISIATVDHAYEDDFGLRFHATFLSNRDGQNVRGMMADRLKRAKETGLSIGFSPITQRRRKDGVNELVKVRLHEVSVLTVRPANEATRVLEVKSEYALTPEGRKLEMRRIYMQMVMKQMNNRHRRMGLI
jgi:Escherichia/Staphylococcus phage prohead protease